MLRKFIRKLTKKSILLLLSIIIRAGMHTLISTHANPDHNIFSETIDLAAKFTAHEAISSTIFYTLPTSAKKIVQRLNTCASNNSLKISDPCTSAMAYLSLSINETNP